MLEFSDLVEEIGDDVLGEVSLGLLLSEPGEVLVLQLQVVELLVEAVERLGVALLVDQALSFSKSRLEFSLAVAELLDTVNLLLFLEAGFLYLSSLSVSSFLASLFNLTLSLIELSLDGIELPLAFLFHGTTEGVKSLLILSSELFNELLRVDLMGGVLPFLVVDSVTTGLLLEELAFKITKFVQLSLLLGEVLFEFALSSLHLGQFVRILLHKLLTELSHSLAVFLTHLSVKLSDQAIWEMLLEDLLLLLDLTLVKVTDILNLTILGSLLNFAGDVGLLAHVIVFNVQQVFVELVVNILLLLLKSHELSRLMSAGNDGINTLLAVSGTLAEFLLLGNLLLHHGENFFLELDALLLVKLKKQVFKLLLVLIVDETLNSRWDLLRSESMMHLRDHLIEGFSRHDVLLRLIILRVINGFLDSLLKLLLFLSAFLLDSLVAARLALSKNILEFLVSLLSLSSELVLDTAVNGIELGHKAVLLLVEAGVVDLVLQALSLIDMSAVRIKDGTVSKLLNLLINHVVFGLRFSGILSLELASNSLLLQLECLFFSTLVFHLVHEKRVGVDLLVKLVGIDVFVIIISTQILLQLVSILLILSSSCGSGLFNLLELFILLHLGLVLSSCASRLESVLKFLASLAVLFTNSFLNVCLGLLIVFKDLLEVLVGARILQFVLEASKSIPLLVFEFLDEVLLLLCALSFILGQVFFKLGLDFLNDLVHLLILCGLSSLDLVFDLLELFCESLTFLATCIETASYEFVMLTFILLHQVLDILHLLLELKNKSIDFFTTSSMLLQHVLEVGSTIVSTGNLLLENSVLLAIDVKDSISGVLLKVLFELGIFFLLPFIELILMDLGVGFSLRLFLFSIGFVTVAIIIEAVHVSLGFGQDVVFTLKDTFVGAEDALQLGDLVVKSLLVFEIIR